MYRETTNYLVGLFVNFQFTFLIFSEVTIPQHLIFRVTLLRNCQNEYKLKCRLNKLNKEFNL
jgi:hypothetical protein